MRRIRVVFSIGAMHGGGSERQMILLLRHLDRTLFEPHLYLVYKSGPLLDQVPTDVPVVSFDTRVTPSRIYLPGLMHSRRVRDYARYLQEVQADVSYDRTFLMTLISAAGAQRAGVPNVSTIVTNPETGFAPVAGRFQRFKKRILHRLYNNSARFWPCPMERVKQRFGFMEFSPIELPRCSTVSMWTGFNSRRHYQLLIPGGPVRKTH